MRLPYNSRSERISAQLESTRQELWAAQRKIRDLVDHVAALRDREVKADEILQSRLTQALRRLARLEADRASQSQAPLSAA